MTGILVFGVWAEAENKRAILRALRGSTSRERSQNQLSRGDNKEVGGVNIQKTGEQRESQSLGS